MPPVLTQTSPVHTSLGFKKASKIQFYTNEEGENFNELTFFWDKGN